MNKPLPWVRGRGLERLLARETNISDLIQLLSDRDSTPWADLVGFVPDEITREALKSDNQADLRLTADGRCAMVEVKLGHLMSAKQQTAYEAITTRPDLYLAGLSSDEVRLPSDNDRWRFLGLSDLIDRWRLSNDELARLLADEAATVLKSWDAMITGVFSHRSSDGWVPMSALTQKFLARVATRRIANDLRDRGRAASAQVTSGGGLAIVQGWTPIRDESADRSFIAEIRWRESKPSGELRFGVDFYPRPGRGEDEEVRRAAHDLARAMDTAIDYAHLKAHLAERQPHLAQLLHREKQCRPNAKGDWERVITHGFRDASLPDGTANNRTKTRPDFYGDGTLRHEAIADVDFEQSSALDLIELIDATLFYLSSEQPS